MSVLLIDELRLADKTIETEKKISLFIENQFPAIYRENGRELIDLVKGYYQFLETQENQSIHNIRRIYEYRNIDTTLDRMLIFFKNKFLNGLFFEKDIRFIVKNILDLYRRKGSTEGIELFFKMFFDSEVTTYFPSNDIFKPSTSEWKTGDFIQLYAVSDTSNFSDIVNKKIFGDKSKAEAFVDNVYFLTIEETLIPILFVSSVNGRFQGFDTVFSNDPLKTYGRIYGSMRKVTVIDEVFTSNNQVGDIVEIRSDTGFGAKGRVSKVSQDLSGQIEFEIVDGGYGYTTSNTSIQLSNQTAFFADPAEGADPVTFIIGERVQQINSSNTLISATVVGQRRTGVGFSLDFTTTDAIQSPETYFLDVQEDSGPIETLDRIENISELPVFVTPPNDSASAEVGPNSIANTEDITVITDLIENYLDVPLDSANYSQIPPALLEMSGTRVNGVIPSLNTPLNEAFVPEDFTIGTIVRLINQNPGQDYFADSFVLARENLLSRFSLRDQVLRIQPVSGVLLFVGDTIRQIKTVTTFEGTQVQTEVRGIIVRSIGNEFFVRQLTFESFVTDEPIFKAGSDIPVTVLSRSRDPSSRPLGLNADINANVETVSGKIQEIEVIDSGFGYVDNSTVEIYNITREEREGIQSISPDCLCAANARSQGLTEGRWITFFSKLSQEKVLQDSFFYQDYSYQIRTDISPETYENEYKELIHPTGMKLFTAFGKTDSLEVIYRLRNIDISTYRVDSSTALLAENSSAIVSENGFGYINTQFIKIETNEVEPVIAIEDGEIDPPISSITADSTIITADSTAITSDRTA
jgi:hypothetical protein